MVVDRFGQLFGTFIDGVGTIIDSGAEAVAGSLGQSANPSTIEQDQTGLTGSGQPVTAVQKTTPLEWIQKNWMAIVIALLVLLAVLYAVKVIK